MTSEEKRARPVIGRAGSYEKGVARRQEILERAAEVRLAVLGIARSPVRGGEGNHEYLVHLTRRTGVGLTWQAQTDIAHELVQEEAR